MSVQFCFFKSVGKICRDINECELSPGICRGGGTCVNTEGSFTCVCPTGLTLDATGELIPVENYQK